MGLSSRTRTPSGATPGFLDPRTRDVERTRAYVQAGSKSIRALCGVSIVDDAVCLDEPALGQVSNEVEDIGQGVGHLDGERAVERGSQRSRGGALGPGRDEPLSDGAGGRVAQPVHAAVGHDDEDLVPDHAM